MEEQKDTTRSDRVINFIERYCTHVKGSLGGQPFIPAPWERDLIRRIYDNVDEDGYRLINFVYVEIPRKNNKTTLLAALSLYHLVADGEYGPEVVISASERNQASISMDISKNMVRQNKALDNLTYARSYDILNKERNGFLKAISSEAGSKHGLNISFCGMDELHTWKGRDLFDVLLTSMVSRKQPLAIAITTAGEEKTGICWEQHEYTKRWMKGEIEDPHFLGIIYAADPEDPWDDPLTWMKANPNYGISVNENYLKRKMLEAKNNPALIPTFKRLHLNIWVSNYTSWLEEQHFYQCTLAEEPDLSQATAIYGGIDLASVSDFVSLALFFVLGDNQYYMKNWYWIPDEMMDKRVARLNILSKWEADGWISRTPGNVISDRVISAEIDHILSMYNVDSIGYDKALAHSGVAQDLVNAGYDMHAQSQAIMALSEPAKKFEKLVRQTNLGNDGNPVTAWMISNVVIYTDPNHNIKLVKNKSIDKIDGVIAQINAIAQWLWTESENPTSIYADNDLYE